MLAPHSRVGRSMRESFGEFSPRPPRPLRGERKTAPAWEEEMPAELFTLLRPRTATVRLMKGSLALVIINTLDLVYSFCEQSTVCNAGIRCERVNDHSALLAESVVSCGIKNVD